MGTSVRRQLVPIQVVRVGATRWTWQATCGNGSLTGTAKTTTITPQSATRQGHLLPADEQSVGGRLSTIQTTCAVQSVTVPFPPSRIKVLDFGV